jgi:tripartite tricarboxylate transporter family receptor
MNLLRRRFLHLAAGAAALPAVARFAWAQTYPVRPVRLIVGFTPGGPTDIAARLMGQWLSERLGQPFIIENRPGAGSNIATEAVVNSPPDGYTLLMVSTSAAVSATFYRNLNFNLIRVAPVAGIVRVPLVHHLEQLTGHVRRGPVADRRHDDLDDDYNVRGYGHHYDEAQRMTTSRRWSWQPTRRKLVFRSACGDEAQ